jgi:hypothetical protein
MMILTTGMFRKLKTSRSMSGPRVSFSIMLFVIVLFITVCTGGAISADIGFRAGFKDGPLISFVFDQKLSERLSLSVPVGGLPGVVMRAEANLRMSGVPQENKWARYIEGGIGYFQFFRGEIDGENIKDIHFMLGLTRNFRKSFWADVGVGMLYAPLSINPWLKDEYPDVVPIVPMVGIEVTYWIR